MSHSRRCHPMLFTVLPVLQTKASSLSAGTELGAAATTVSSLYQQAKLLNNTDLLGNTDAIFFLNRPSPFHSSHPSLPSLCPLLGATIPSLSLFHSAAAAKAERSCQHTLLLFDSCFFLSQSFTLKYSSWVNGTMAALAVKDFYLSQLHALCVFPLLSSFFMFLQVNVMQARVPGEQMALRKRKKVKV